jgi:hypothetical protein
VVRDLSPNVSTLDVPLGNLTAAGNSAARARQPHATCNLITLGRIITPPVRMTPPRHGNRGPYR